MLYLYNAAFSQFKFGYAAAVGVILFIVIFGGDADPAAAVRRGSVVVRRRRPARASRPPGRAGRSPHRASPVAPERRWPRRLAYVVLIGYAILMFVPFAWSVITSFKTLPDSVKLTFIPQPFTLDAYDYIFTELDPALPRLFFNSAIIAVAVTITNVVLGSIAGYAFARLQLPRPRGAVPDRPGDADDPGPAPARARLPDPQCARPDQGRRSSTRA